MPARPKVASPQLTPPLGVRVIAIYLRLSRKSKTSVSIEVQEVECREYIARMGWTEPIVVFKDAKSASDRSTVRAGYDLLLAWCKAGHVVRIVCRDDDRLVRQPIELENLIDHLDPAQVPVHFYRSGDLDLTNSAGRANARIRGAIARQEVERKSERQKESNGFRASQGAPMGTTPSFGFKYVKGSTGVLPTYEQVPKHAEAIRWAERFILRGGGLAGVAREWESRGILNPQGRPYRWDGVKMALLNPAIAGKLAYQPSSVLTAEKTPRLKPWLAPLKDGNWKPIIPYVRWQALVTILTKEKRSSGNSIKWLASGIMLCGICEGDHEVYCRNYNDGRRPRAYFCFNKWHGSVRAEAVDDYLLSLLRDIVSAGEFREDEADQGTDRASLLAEKKKLNEQLTDLTASFARLGINIGQLEAGTKAINERISEIDALLGSGAAQEAHSAFMEGLDPEEIRKMPIEHQRSLLADRLPEIRLFMPPGGKWKGAYNDVSPAVYVHAYDRRGRLRPLPLDEETYQEITVPQFETAEAYGKPILVNGVPVEWDRGPRQPTDTLLDR